MMKKDSPLALPAYTDIQTRQSTEKRDESIRHNYIDMYPPQRCLELSSYIVGHDNSPSHSEVDTMIESNARERVYDDAAIET